MTDWRHTGLRRQAGRVVRALPSPVANIARSSVQVLDRTRSTVADARDVWQVRRRHPMPDVPATAVRLLVGPVNSAGQGYAWARVAERHGPGVVARNLSLTNKFEFPADYSVAAATYVSDEWSRAHERYVLKHYTHIISEAGRPLLGERYGKGIESELPVYEAAAIPVALLSHGSDTRVPSLHAQREKWSPFRDPDWELVSKLERGAIHRTSLFNDYSGHILVSTPDMLDDLPRAAWCPVVVDVEVWGGEATTLDRDRPVVVHIPSHSRLKGTEFVEPVLTSLAERGLIEFRAWEGLTASEMVAAYRDADIVVDQMRLGIYGVAACEGMAAGRVVVSHVAEHVRDRVRGRTGLDLPIMQAEPDTLEDVLQGLVAHREEARAVAQRGIDFVRVVHDGRMSADALTPFLAGAQP